VSQSVRAHHVGFCEHPTFQEHLYGQGCAIRLIQSDKVESLCLLGCVLTPRSRKVTPRKSHGFVKDPTPSDVSPPSVVCYASTGQVSLMGVLMPYFQELPLDTLTDEEIRRKAEPIVHPFFHEYDSDKSGTIGGWGGEGEVVVVMMMMMMVMRVMRLMLMAKTMAATLLSYSCCGPVCNGC
jgi:hypothetical protein